MDPTSAMTTTPKQRVVIGPLDGPAGNAFAILGACRVAMRKAGRLADWPAFEADAKSGDYAHLLDTVEATFEVVYRGHHAH